MNATRAAAILVFSLAGELQQEKPASQEKPSSHDMSSCPMHEPHKAAAQDKYQRGVIERGDHVMGFAHDKATHHFLLYSAGGAIDVQANKPEDSATRDAIRSHFAHIVKMFAAGDFSAPILIHSQNPPGTETMTRLREQIQYKVESTAGGARIRITTKNEEALQAVHTFLRFQIADHQTGDSTEVILAP
jgi:hypothetical protein